MPIGHEPSIETLVLVQGQDFTHSISVPPGETIADGTDIDLIIYDQVDAVMATWSATVTETAAVWNVPTMVADTINIPGHFRIYVHYSDGVDMCWYRGQVTRQG